MTLQDDVSEGVETVLSTPWDTRDGTTVPSTDTVKLKDGAVKVDATWVYADLAESSKLAQTVSHEVTGKVIRSYLNAASRLLKHYGGEIRSFDGDRVMAIFIGGSKNSNAVRAALAINWAVSEVLKPKLEGTFLSTLANWDIKHGIGIATGEALIVRGGVRNSNDLVSIGEAPNVAAKLSELRTVCPIHITESVYNQMNEAQRLSVDKTENRWTKIGYKTIGGASYLTYGSGWWWAP